MMSEFCENIIKALLRRDGGVVVKRPPNPEEEKRRIHFEALEAERRRVPTPEEQALKKAQAEKQLVDLIEQNNKNIPYLQNHPVISSEEKARIKTEADKQLTERIDQNKKNNPLFLNG